MRAPHLTFGPYAFDPGSRVLRRAGEELPLPPRVVGVLEVLLRRAGDVVPRQELIESVWKDAFVTDTSLAEAVSALRQALGDDPQAPTYVQTLHRRGYRFVAPVKEAPDNTRSRTAAGGAATDEAVSPRPSIGGELVPWSLAVLFALLAAFAVWQAVAGRRAAEPAVARFEIPLPAGTRLDARAPALAVSPDGSATVWAGCDTVDCRLYIRSLEKLAPAAIAGTEGGAFPFFSPDGKWLGFFADGKLKKLPLAGGAPVTLAEAPDVRGAVWTRRHGIVYAGSSMGGLWRVADHGGEPAIVTTPRAADGEVGHAWPSLTPSGDVLLFTIATAPLSAGGSLGALPAETLDGKREWRTLAAGVERPIAATPDAVVFSHGSELQSTWFDRPRLSVAGGAPAVISPVASSLSGAHFAISPAGVLALAAPALPAVASFSWIHAGAEIALPPIERRLNALDLSDDGTRLAGSEDPDANRADIWIADIPRGRATRITHSGQNTAPIWSGSTLYYAARDRGAYAIWSRDVDAPSAAPVKRHAGSAHSFPVSVKADGSALAILQRGESTGSDLWLLPLDGGQARPLVQGPFEEIAAAFSPDGALLAYQSNEAGRWDVYLQRLADGKRTMVSRGGGTRPVWSPDGRKLCFQAKRNVMCATVDAAADLGAGVPQHAATAEGELIGIDRSGRILIRRLPSQPASVVLTLHWTRELLRILGPPPAPVPR